MWALGNFERKDIPKIMTTNIAGEISDTRSAAKKKNLGP